MSATPLFTDFGLDDDLTAALGERGIVHPFPIQEITLPLALKGHDIIGQARTGTGKTLGFGLPLLQRIDASKAQTQAMVIVPTRELCIQVADDLTIGSDRGITTIAVYGGVGYDEQIEALTGGVHVVIGTPGRTIDHLNRGNLDVSQIHTVVLDEADEMLDMGFLPDVERLLADVPDDRQTMLFSATMPTEIVKLARRFMAKPTFMRADETLHETAPTVDQHFFLVHRMDKPRVLARLLQMPDRGGAFVFCRTKRMCDRLVQELADLGVAAIAVHGDLRQSSRQKNLDRFRDGKADVLVATEVAARGLDVSNVSHVVNYDCPDDEKMYLHRIGRTARAGESGMAVTFAEFNEVDRVNVIRKRVAVEEEMVEIFSTSDELTKLFDLPDETPWDALTSSKSSRPSSRSGSGSSKSKSKDSRSKARKSSSGSNRSSPRGAQGRSSSTRGSSGRSSRDSSKSKPDAAPTSTRASGAAQNADNDSSDKGRTTRRVSPSSSRTRSRSRSRTSTEAVIADAKKSRDSSPSNGSDRSATRADNDENTSSGARRRSSRSSDDTNARTSRTSSDSTDGGDKPSRGDGTDKKADSSGSSGGGRKRARPRARRNRDAQSSSNGSSSRTTGRSDNDGNDKSSAARTRGGASRGSNSGGGTSRSSNSRSTSTRGNDTTRRGDDARGDGTPRPRRRVDVEHLP